MCRIDFVILVRFQFGFWKKNSDLVWNELGSVPFKKCGSVRIYSKYYSDSGRRDFDVTDITHNNDNK